MPYIRVTKVKSAGELLLSFRSIDTFNEAYPEKGPGQSHPSSCLSFNAEQLLDYASDSTEQLLLGLEQ